MPAFQPELSKLNVRKLGKQHLVMAINYCSFLRSLTTFDSDAFKFANSSCLNFIVKSDVFMRVSITKWCKVLY